MREPLDTTYPNVTTITLIFNNERNPDGTLVEPRNLTVAVTGRAIEYYAISQTIMQRFYGDIMDIAIPTNQMSAPQ